MPRRISNPKIDSRSARARLTPRREPYWAVMSIGCALGYRRIVPSGSWVGRFRDDIGKQHYEAFGAADDIRDADDLTALSFSQAQNRARAFFERRARELAGDVLPKAGTFTVTEAISRYLVSYRRRGGKAVDKVESVARTYISEDLGRMPVAKLTKGRIEAWHEGIATSGRRVRAARGKPARVRVAPSGPDFERRRKATANRALTVLKAALNHAYHEGLAAHDDAWRRVKAYRNVAAARVQYLSDHEATRLVNACDPDFRKLVIGALMTGCRYGELIAMVAADFDPMGGTVCVRQSKSGKPRYVALSEEGIEHFQAVTLNRAGSDRIFTKVNGTDWSRSEQQRPFVAACEQAKLTGIRFHGLRHTYASRLVMKGAPLAVVSAQLGHSDTRMVEKHYGHLAPNYVRDTVRSLYSRIGVNATDNVVTFPKVGT